MRRNRTHSGLALREIPSVESLLASGSLGAWAERMDRASLVRAIREGLAALRERVRRESWPADRLRRFFQDGTFASEIGAAVGEEARSAYRRVVNATGVVLHTGLGRAPLPAAAIRAIARELRGYSLVEVDRETGERSIRESAAAALLRARTGAEAATVVNNNAAAVLLALHALARGKEVVVSRGELVEIGGGFRVPEVMAQSGAVLVEVGTTNRVRLADYEDAIGRETGAILKVHPSNFRVVGFTQSVEIAALARLARKKRIPLLADLGSGLLEDLPGGAFPEEPRVRATLAQGADLATFSGDKLLGGPQCGIAVGRAALVRRLRADPLFRALRVDKLTLVALEATLRTWETPVRAGRENQAARLLGLAPRALRSRAERLARALRRAAPSIRFEVAEGSSQVGSGSIPAVDLPTFVVRAASRSIHAAELSRRLRLSEPPIFARVHRDRVVMDLRTILRADEPAIVRAFAAVAGGSASP